MELWYPSTRAERRADQPGGPPNPGGVPRVTGIPLDLEGAGSKACFEIVAGINAGDALNEGRQIGS